MNSESGCVAHHYAYISVMLFAVSIEYNHMFCRLLLFLFSVFHRFKYLGSQMAADGGCEKDVVHIMNEGYRE